NGTNGSDETDRKEIFFRQLRASCFFRSDEAAEHYRLCPGRRETERNSVSARGAENARPRSGKHNWRRASNETLTKWERFVTKPGQVLFYKSNLQPGELYAHVKQTLITCSDLRQCLYGRRRAGSQRLSARHDHRFKWGVGGRRDRHYHGDAHEYQRDDRYQRRRELRLPQRQRRRLSRRGCTEGLQEGRARERHRRRQYD